MELPQLAEFARLATPLARFGKVGRAASKQTVWRSEQSESFTTRILRMVAMVFLGP
jgi:hypothetical protein